MNLERWVLRTYQTNPWWTCLQFDMAVVWFGRYVENKLNELDSKGRHVYTIDELLDEDATSLDQFDAFAGALGALR